jgi:hypothetical protein
MARLYEVLFYNGWQDPPAYYLLAGVEGRSPKEALQRNLPTVIQEIRQEFSLDDDVDDRHICESLYALRSNGLVPARSILSQ